MKIVYTFSDGSGLQWSYKNHLYYFFRPLEAFFENTSQKTQELNFWINNHLHKFNSHNFGGWAGGGCGV